MDLLQQRGSRVDYYHYHHHCDDDENYAVVDDDNDDYNDHGLPKFIDIFALLTTYL